MVNELARHGLFSPEYGPLLWLTLGDGWFGEFFGSIQSMRMSRGILPNYLATLKLYLIYLVIAS